MGGDRKREIADGLGYTQRVEISTLTPPIDRASPPRRCGDVGKTEGRGGYASGGE
jgi:hypothetical protein